MKVFPARGPILVCPLVLASVLSACGGGGGSAGQSLLPLSNPPTLQNGTSTPLTLSGQISSVSTGSKFLLQSTQCGSENVTLSSSTTETLNGQTVKTGVYALVTGTGSCPASVVATSLTLSAAPLASTPSPTPPPTPAPTPTPTPPPGTVNVSGPIMSVAGAQILVQSIECGSATVTTTASTVITSNGLTLKTGVNILANGPGSCSTGVTALRVTLSAVAPSPSPSPSPGPSAGPTTVPTTVPTAVASAVPTAAPTANPTIAPPPPNTPSHIPLWAYDEYTAEGENATSAQVAKLVTYAEGGLGNAKAVADCNGSGSCYSVWYVDPNLIYDSSTCPDPEYAPFLAASQESWYVHESGYTDSGHRVQGTYSVSCSAGNQSEPVYVANDANPSVQAYFQSYLQANGDAWNYYMMDDTKGTVVDQMYGSSGGFCGGSYCTTTQELPTNASVVASHGAFANGLTHVNGTPMQFFFNGFSFDGGQNANDLSLLGSSSSFVGGVCENCIVDAGVFEPASYAPVLNAMASVDNTSGASFALLSTGDSPAGSGAQIAQRLVTTAVAWLGFSPGHTIVWPNLEYNTTNLAAWPEDQIYPSAPVQSMSSSAGDIQVASGVWRREFASCSNNGVAIGRCAAILNGNGGAVTVASSWLSQSYGHVIQLTGGDTLSGGTLSSTAQSFTANSTTIQADQAVLLAQ